MIINDRARPIARFIPFDSAPDEWEDRLIAEGRLNPAIKPMDWDRFDAIGKGIRLPDLTQALHRAMSKEREDGHVGFLGAPAKRRGRRVVARSLRGPKRP